MAEVQIIGCEGGSVDPCAGVPQATIEAVGPFDENDGIQNLQASPSGGTWGGDALANGSFDTSQGPGTYTITYSYADGNGCNSSDSFDILVNTALDPCDSYEIAITPIGNLDTESGIQFLNAQPAGGNWSGDSSDGSFDPSIGEGTYSITYTVDFGQGCVKSDTITIIVNQPGSGSCTSTQNIALNGTASQSSTYGVGSASYAIDGNTNGTSPWSADLQHTNEESQPWWQVDLDDLSTIEEIIIYNRTDKLQQRLNNFLCLCIPHTI